MNVSYSSTFFALALVLGSQGLMAAPPINDTFANRIEVFVNDTPESASTIDATTTGEPIPAGYDSGSYQATVWYTWYCDAGDYYDFNTDGSSIDTVLAVWTTSNPSPALGNLELVHVSDNTRFNLVNQSTSGTNSRVRFNAQTDTTYYFSVASKGSARGGVNFAVSTTSLPVVSSLNSLSLSNSSPNVTASTASVTTTIGMAITNNVTSGSLRIYDPSRYLVTTVPWTSDLVSAGGNRTSGNNFSGTYQITFTLPRYLPPGTYSIALRAQNPALLKAAAFGWEELSPYPVGFTSTFTVINTGAVDTYTQWLNQNGLSGANTAKAEDFDGDGIQNLAEFAFGLDPRAASSASLLTSGATIVQRGLPKITLVGAAPSQRLRVEFVRKQSEPLVTMNAQFGETLLDWANAVNASTVIASGGGYDVLAVEDQIFDPVRDRRFARIRIDYALP